MSEPPDPAPGRGDRPRRVLLIRPDHLGDVLFVGPAVARLRAAWPDAEVTLLVGPWSAPAAERLPGVDRVEVIDFPWFNRRPEPSWRKYARLAAAARRLRGRFGAAAVMRDDDRWSAWLTMLAGVPIRAGHAHPRVAPFIQRRAPAGKRSIHSVAMNVAAVAALTGASEPAPTPRTDPLRFTLSPEDHDHAAALLAAPGSDPTGGLVAVHPGAGAAVKRWRAGAWGEVVRAVTAPGETVVLTGSSAERELTAAVAACAGRSVVDVAGRTDVGSLAAVFARCRLVLGPDSGPLHLAVAVGTPTVHLFGPAPAERFGPWGDAARHRVVASELPCAPCGRLDWPAAGDHPCVRTLAAGRVIEAARAAGGV